MAYLRIRNVWLKLLSVAIATLLWLIVAGDRVVERVMRLPLEFENLPDGLEIVTDTPDAVEVRLRGRSSALGSLTPVDAWATIDLRAAHPGRRLYNLGTGHVRVPYGVEVVQVTPSTLSLDLEEAGVSVIPVRPAIDGRPADGFEVVEVSTVPATVEVIGPASALSRLHEATTEPVLVSGAKERVAEVVSVGVIDPWVRLKTPQTVVVTVSIAPVKP